MPKDVSINLSELDVGRTLQASTEFRFIVPDGTTTQAPKLQQAWRDMATGEVVWLAVRTEVVPMSEFERALAL